MCVIGKDKLERLVENYKCIYPASPSLFDGDGYVLTVMEDITLQYLEHKNLISYEVVFIPPDMVAHLTAKSKYGRMGLSFLNAAKVHSGFIGRLALEVVNLSNDRTPITIMHGDPFMHIEFITRDGAPSPYMGTYMFQYMTDDEISIYMNIVNKYFSDIYDIGMLRKLALSRIRL
ncbi:MAG: hypothetical protein QXQ29_06830 [Candidatus Bathyarchaeia archaeon]